MRCRDFDPSLVAGGARALSVEGTSNARGFCSQIAGDHADPNADALKGLAVQTEHVFLYKDHEQRTMI
jgi:hypothetical protein